MFQLDSDMNRRLFIPNLRLCSYGHLVSFFSRWVYRSDAKNKEVDLEGSYLISVSANTIERIGNLAPLTSMVNDIKGGFE